MSALIGSRKSKTFRARELKWECMVNSLIRAGCTSKGARDLRQVGSQGLGPVGQKASVFRNQDDQPGLYLVFLALACFRI